MSDGGNDGRLDKILAFLEEADRLKSIYRGAHLADHSRNESAAEHIWHLCVFAMLLREESALMPDPLRVLELCLIHDMVEIYAGDTWAYDREGTRIKRSAKSGLPKNSVCTVARGLREALEVSMGRVRGRPNERSEICAGHGSVTGLRPARVRRRPGLAGAGRRRERPGNASKKGSSPILRWPGCSRSSMSGRNVRRLGGTPRRVAAARTKILKVAPYGDRPPCFAPSSSTRSGRDLVQSRG